MAITNAYMFRALKHFYFLDYYQDKHSNYCKIHSHNANTPYNNIADHHHQLFVVVGVAAVVIKYKENVTM